MWPDRVSNPGPPTYESGALPIDGWMTCDFTSFSTVFQSYQDDGRIIMKGCVQCIPFMIEKMLASGGARTHDR